MKTLLLLLTVLFSFNATGQIIGKVTSTNGEAVPYANVVLFTVKDSVAITGTTTNENGEFKVNTDVDGEFFLRISSIGYQSYQSESFVYTNSPIQLSTVNIAEENHELKEVKISARREFIQTTPIGKVINVQSSLMAKGSNALQVLERLPGIISDRRNNQFSLNGQSGITILFNGRRVPMSMEELFNLLESTVADNIEKIELITSPTAQYDADGGAGIINIIFKKNDNEGTKLNLSATAGFGYREKASTAVSLSHGFKKANVNLAYSFGHSHDYSGYRGQGTSYYPFIGGFNSTIFGGLTDRTQQMHNLNVAAEYNPSPKTSIGGEISLVSSRMHNLVEIIGDRIMPDGSFLGSKGLSDGTTGRQNFISSGYFQHNFSSKSQLNLDLSYIDYANSSPTLVTYQYFDKDRNEIPPTNPIFNYGNRGQSQSRINVAVFKADYTRQVNPDVKIETGIKGSYTLNSNNSNIERKVSDLWEIDPRTQSNINGNEKILAAYSQLRFVFNSKSIFHAGLRYEYWQRDINIYKNGFTISKFFPSLLYTYTLNTHTNLNFSYGRRITRPAYNDLISNLFYNDATFIFSGNPLLKPTITDALKAEFNKNGFNIGLSFQYDLHPILRYQITANPQNDIGVSSPQNLDYQKSINLFINAPFQITSWWKFSISSTTAIRRYKISYSLNPAEKTYLFQNLNFTQRLSLPENFEIELSGWQNLPFFEGANRLKGFGVVNLSIAKKLKNDKGSFQLSLPDLFQTSSIYTHIGSMTPIAFNIRSESNYKDESAFYRVIKLTYSRSFGKNTKNINRTNGEEELERVKK
ncbi:TonB-dependent receptor domain-containing protein [Emticicia sp. BO119]|uniref:TonB-dependent receptor domain-containing protein n=1 Tax=Emticicia sp. BO119 TaxID=2757768 RepID=UPI0015F0D956|nr:TonB-dependent receptor [Emticicia sp. BO119]MBA4849366.1 TonB-dependent receptor [Emticicia sp. BO119]